MSRPDQRPERRAELLPLVAGVFVRQGYRRTTTAALARRCGVKEPILYRLWPDKKSMFLAAIDHVYGASVRLWGDLLAEGPPGTSAAERILAYEAGHYGEFGLYRILFAGLGETDDPDIRRHMRRTYRRFHEFIRERIDEHREARGGGADPGDPSAAGTAAWMVLGIGTIVGIARELDLLGARAGRELLLGAGSAILGTPGLEPGKGGAS
jgi:AcrR family transcriptional regulator